MNRKQPCSRDPKIHFAHRNQNFLPTQSLPTAGSKTTRPFLINRRIVRSKISFFFFIQQSDNFFGRNVIGRLAELLWRFNVSRNFGFSKRTTAGVHQRFRPRYPLFHLLFQQRRRLLSPLPHFCQEYCICIGSSQLYFLKNSFSGCARTGNFRTWNPMHFYRIRSFNLLGHRHQHDSIHPIRLYTSFPVYDIFRYESAYARETPVPRFLV